MSRIVSPADGPLFGDIRVPGDKSVSHRAIIFAAMAEGTSRIEGLPSGQDVLSTIAAVATLGAKVEKVAESTLSITGWGELGPTQPSGPVDCGNSGTTVRLLAGVVAGWPIEVTFVGDASLSKRPMARVAEPLLAMGAAVTTTDGTLPLTVRGGPLRSIRYDSPVASAQVKTLVLLAGMRASGRVAVREPAPSRDHTERMLPAFEVSVTHSADRLTSHIEGPVVPIATDITIPGDPSSAAFFAAGAAIIGGSDVVIEGLLLNPTRTASLDVLRRMGAHVVFDHQGVSAGEDVGALTVVPGPALSATTIPAKEVPALIDEIPVLAVVATQATGVTRFEGVGELRVKESDRLEAIFTGLSALGAQIRIGEDWLEIEGPSQLIGATVESLGDHRLAMAYHIAALVADDPVTIEGYEATAVSYPGFALDLEALLE